MQALLERYAPSELLLGVVTGAALLFTQLPFVAVVALAYVATTMGQWLDHFGVRRVS